MMSSAEYANPFAPLRHRLPGGVPGPVGLLLLLIGLVPAIAQELADDPPESGEVAPGDTGSDEEAEEEEETKPQGPTFTDETSRRILQLHEQAMGGSEALHELRSIRITGTLREGKDYFDMEWLWKAPDRYRVVRKHRLLGREYITIRVFDGQEAWTQELSPDKEPAKLLPKGEAELLSREADFLGPLIDWEAKGHHFNYFGTEDRYDPPVYVLECQIQDGPVNLYYFDPKTFLLRRVGFEDSFGSQMIFSDRVLDRYARVAGIWLPRQITYYQRGKIYREVEWERIRPNVEIDDALFQRPVPREYWLRPEDP